MEEADPSGSSEDATEMTVAEPEIIDVEQFVAQALTTFDPLKAQIDELKESVASTVFDLATVRGNKAARSMRAKLKAIPGALEEAYKAWNQPRLRAAEAMRAKRDELIALIPGIVDPLDKQIQADEERRENERLERVRAEAARVGAIRQRITNLSSLVVTQISKSSGELQTAIEFLRQQTITEEVFQEFTDEAKQTLATAITGLEQLHAGALQREENEREAERLRQEAAEREKKEQEQREEQARIDAENQRKAAVAAEEAKAAAQKLADEAERKRQEDLDNAKRVAEEHQAELKRQQDAFEEERTAAAAVTLIQSKMVDAATINDSAELVSLLEWMTQYQAPTVREDLALQISGALDRAIPALTGMIERAKAAEAIEQAKAEAASKADATGGNLDVVPPAAEEPAGEATPSSQAGPDLESALLEANSEAAGERLTPEELAMETVHAAGVTARPPARSGGASMRAYMPPAEPPAELKAAVDTVIAAKRPTDWIILDTLATNFGVKHAEALDWLQDMDMFALQEKVKEI